MQVIELVSWLSCTYLQYLFCSGCDRRVCVSFLGPLPAVSAPYSIEQDQCTRITTFVPTVHACCALRDVVVQWNLFIPTTLY